MYVLTTLEKKKTVNSLLQNVADAGAHDMLEENTMDDSEPAESSSLVR